MADLTITITNSLNFFGIAPSNKWAEYNWGAFLWGEGTNDLACSVGKLITNTQSIDDSLTKHAEKVIDAGSMTLTSDAADQYLTDASGAYHEWPKPTTDSNERITTSWTDDSTTSTSYTEDSDPGTSWDEA